MIGLSDIRNAHRRISKHIRWTPLAGSKTLSLRVGVPLVFKLELFQKTGSFKVRGVLNCLQQLSPQEKKRGVISMSSGNHAQALAWGAASLEIASTIVMPEWSNAGKVKATRSYGGEVVLTSRPLMDVLGELQQERGLAMVHPFDDPNVIAGQGTVGWELVKDLPEANYVLVTVGGGGLIAGVATAVKASWPGVKVIGIEPEGAPAMTRSLEAGHPVTLDKVDTICDGLAAPFAGVHTLEVVQKSVDEVLLVSDQEVIEALKLLVERLKVVPEASAAAALAPLLSGRLTLPSDATVVCILCGGNVDCPTLSKLLAS